MGNSSDFLPDADGKERFLQSLQDKLEQISAFWHKLSHEDWTQVVAEQLLDAIQDICSNALLHDLTKLHERARAIEAYLDGYADTGKAASDSQIEELNNLFQQLEVVISEITSEHVPAPQQPTGKLVFCLQHEAMVMSELQPHLEKLGFETSQFDDASDMAKNLHDHAPAVIVVETTLLKAIAPLKNELQRLKAQYNMHIPVVFVASHDDIQLRVSAMRVGADRYFSPPHDLQRIASEVRNLASPQSLHKNRVLIIEDDPPQAEFAASILRKAEMIVQTVTHPLHVMDALKQFNPDIILMDIYMPDANGLELTTIIRDDLRFTAIPIVFLSGETDPDKQLDALELGGDDFISKPIRPRHLISVVNNRIQRTRELVRAISLQFECGDAAEVEAMSNESTGEVQAELLGDSQINELPLEGAPAGTTTETATPSDPLQKIADDIRQAFATEGFVNYYQPILSVKEHLHDYYSLMISLPGTDTFFSWKDLMPAAKKYELQGRLDKWAIDQAIDALDQLRKQGKQGTIFIPQSISSLHDDSVPEWILSRLRSRQIVGTNIALEFNLKELAYDLKAGKNYFDRLKLMGLGICVTDFPAKKAAFKLIRFLGIDYLKVSDKLLNTENTVINSFINQAHKHAARVIVSDISDPRYVNLHWTSVADFIQGDFISPPGKSMDFDFNQSTL
ncbi:MAG: response regulator [Chromatiales bacterium]|jgi:PleD family two-component response regulator/EAL domain-containing protein (putative c-di-GMP-specific phosphodiesterase class I)